MEGKVVYLVGTVHISEVSRKKVEETIRTVMPPVVCLELDAQRFSALRRLDAEGGHFRYSPGVSELMTLPGLMRWLQQKLGDEFGIFPGSEMLSAYQTARAYKIPLALVDQPVQYTIARMWGGMGFGEKMKMVAYLGATAGAFLLKPLFGNRTFALLSFMGETRQLDLRALERGEGVDELLGEFKGEFPSVYRVLVEERNAVMTRNVLALLNKFDILVVVVGLGHVSGMRRLLKREGVKVELA
jgi:pheromone shutdown protein TraB